FRPRGDMRDHAPDSKARRAATTARFTSSTSHAATWVITRPVAGFTVGNVLPEAASTNLPSMNARVSRFSAAAAALQSVVWFMRSLLAAMARSRDRPGIGQGVARGEWIGGVEDVLVECRDPPAAGDLYRNIGDAGGPA